MVAPLIVAALIGAAASVATGIIGSNAANQASQAQTKAGNQALALQKEQYEQGRADTMPWMQAGQTALSTYMNELGIGAQAQNGTFQSSFQQTPGYQFAVDEGERGVVNNMRALGMGNSGAALKALTRFRTGIANQEYGGYMNRLGGVAGMGQAQAGQNAAMGNQYGAQAGQTMQGIGDVRASGYMGQANAWNGAISNFANTMGTALGQYDNNWQYTPALGRQPPPTGTPGIG